MSTTQFIKRYTTGDVPPVLPDELSMITKYEPDTFQKFAIHAIHNGENVLVTAPTGSGKTYVGEYQIAHSIKQGKRVFYTTPIKSLSNQKFHDLRQMFPAAGMVGIMTGDIKFCPDAQIIVMTTEILRNLLYKRGTSTEHIGITASLSIDNLGAVIFDECHYINDPDRGKVWEETMILLPRDVQLILLSATLDAPHLFAEWLGELKQVPCHLIQTQHRVVPLTHYVISNDKNLTPIMNAKEDFLDSNYADWVRNRERIVKDHDAYQKRVKAERQAGTEGAISGKVKPQSFQHQLNEAIAMLESKELLPALCFMLSRKGCESLASRTEHTLLDSSDAAAAQNIFDFHLRHHKKDLETLQQYHTLRELVAKGIAFHHSGVLPLLKEIIEILFTKGYIKLLYCTETFAVGLNMPTKTVLFTGLTKYDDHTGGQRFLRTDEYIQMAGRAGRRGKDTMGTVIYLPEREPPMTGEMRTILKGGRPQIKSRMDFHYDFILKTFQSKELRWMDIQERSYWYRQKQSILVQEQKHLAAMRSLLDAQPLDPQMEADLILREQIEELVKTTANAARRDAQRQLNRWNDTHLGPRWGKAMDTWKEIKRIRREISMSDGAIQAMQEDRGNVETWISILKAAGFMDDDGLTSKGVMATECNESNGMVLSEFIMSGAHNALTGEELVTVLACFIEESDTENAPTLNQLQVPEAVRHAFHQIDGIVKQFQSLEDKHQTASSNDYWMLSTNWIEPIQRWIRGESAGQICSDYGLFEGNFVRTVLRVNNMVDECTALCTLLSDVNALEKISQIAPTLVRDLVAPDSLYLRL